MSILPTTHCLYCDQPIGPDYRWSTFFLGEMTRLLCTACEKKIVPVPAPSCTTCSRPKTNENAQYFENDQCLDCLRWETQPQWQHTLTKNHSLYLYNDFMAELIARYKYRGDYALNEIFAKPIKNLAQTLEFDLVVPIPLSKERLYERGFNQVED